MISRKFREFLRQGKLKTYKDSNDTSLCFKCNKSGHMKKDFPLLMPKANFNNFNKLNNSRRRRRRFFRQLGMIVTLPHPIKKKQLNRLICASWLKKTRYPERIDGYLTVVVSNT